MPTTFQNDTQSCLLKGTLVSTPSGYRKIEALKEGDPLFNQTNDEILVEKILCNTYTFRDDNSFNIVYKIPKGSEGNSSDVYLTRGHRVIRKSGNSVLPEKLGYLPAKYSEVFDEFGNYTVYHVRVKDGVNNHIVVNGGCIVESWR